MQLRSFNWEAISGTAVAAWSLFTVMRTISLPASARSFTCFTVASISAVSVSVMDCTTIGLPPPIWMLPTCTVYVRSLARRDMAG